MPIWVAVVGDKRIVFENPSTIREDVLRMISHELGVDPATVILRRRDRVVSVGGRHGWLGPRPRT